MSIKVAKTTNRLPFSELNPLRFEDLCLVIVSRITKWRELNHFGRTGMDGGVDIHGIELLNSSEKVWFIQCKRYIRLTKTVLENVINDATKNTVPDKLLLIASCDVSRGHYDYFKLYSKKRGVKDSEIWTAGRLETLLYNDHKDLLFVYFGLKMENKNISNEARIRYSLKMNKRMKKDFINHAFVRENIHKVVHDPMLQFNSDRVIIHSTDDIEYPNNEKTPKGQISPWFRIYLYDFYHNGIEVWLGATLGQRAIFDKKGYWEPIDCFDKRRDNPKYKTIEVKMIGRIPFYNIVDYKTEGDEYYPEPHIYCKFNFNGEPYEKIYFRNYGNPDERIPDWELDENMRTTFPKL